MAPFQKLDKAQGLRESSSFPPAPTKDNKTDHPPKLLILEEIAVLDTVREEQPNYWEAFRKASSAGASHDLLMQLLELAESSLSDQPHLEYHPPLHQQQPAAEPMEQDSFLIHNGVPYMPLSEAARHAGVNRETLLTWTKNKITFDGEPIETLYFKPTGNHFISKRSVEKIVNRFERWPSAEPAGAINLGKTEQGSEYLSTSDAARMIGVPGGTLRRWVRQGTSPLERPLDVIRDTSSGYFYIQSHDVIQLAEHVKKFGAARGPRVDAFAIPQLS